MNDGFEVVATSDNQYAYWTEYTVGISVWDVSNPATPSFVRLLPGSSPWEMELAPDNSYLYAQWYDNSDNMGIQDGFQIFDLTDPASPILVSTQTQIGCYHISVDHENKVLYCWNFQGNPGISAWDVSDPANPAQLQHYDLPRYIMDGWVQIGDVWYHQEHAYTVSLHDLIILSVPTIGNSPPHAAPTGAGIYEIFMPVILGASVSDFDGDLLTYEWLEGSELLFSSTVQAVVGGAPVQLPGFQIDDLYLGVHSLTLVVDDGLNEPVTTHVVVEIIDSTKPTLAPIANKTILWPPNHKMVDIFIGANAMDNSGGPVTLSVSVASSEPEEGLGDGDMSPDWTEPVIDQENGIITLQLRAERSGSGDGRVYIVTVTATDESGNSSRVNMEIIVPHDMRKKQ